MLVFILASQAECGSLLVCVVLACWGLLGPECRNEKKISASTDFLVASQTYTAQNCLKL